MKHTIAVLSALVVAARAACPNSCSGHGYCDEQQQCQCYLEGKVLNKDGNLDTDTRLAQWTGADCSQMTCPRGVSWTRAAGSQDHEHGVECSDIGACNRLTGECICHDGFGGIACARNDCPNNCNGHGMCRSNRQFAEKYARSMSTARNLKYFLPFCKEPIGDTQYEAENCAREIEHLDNYFNTYMATYDDAWDSNLQWGCDCDQGFFGPDCSLRECPSSFDPLDSFCDEVFGTLEDFSVFDQVTGSTITLSSSDEDIDVEAFGSKYIDYLSQFNQDLFVESATGDVTATFKHFSDYSRSVRPGHFPNTGAADNDTLANAVNTGSYIIPISPDQAYYTNRYDPVAIITNFCGGRLSAQECSGRGMCDHATGLCSCFEGYTMEDCSEPEELV